MTRANFRFVMIMLLGIFVLRSANDAYGAAAHGERRYIEEYLTREVIAAGLTLERGADSNEDFLSKLEFSCEAGGRALLAAIEPELMDRFRKSQNGRYVSFHHRGWGSTDVNVTRARFVIQSCKLASELHRSWVCPSYVIAISTTSDCRTLASRAVDQALLDR